MLTRAWSILRYAHESAEALLKAFDLTRTQRSAGPGATTDEEQDLLRAMLVFAAAGLDSMLKQIIRESMAQLMILDEGARRGLLTFAERRLRADGTGAIGADSTKFLARLLTSRSPQRQVIREYIEDLVGGSLQSSAELARAIAAFGCDAGAVGLRPDQLTPVFRIRNQIIHELDINFEHPKRNRQTRRRDEMVNHSNALLELGERVLRAVDTKLKAQPPEPALITVPRIRRRFTRR